MLETCVLSVYPGPGRHMYCPGNHFNLFMSLSAQVKDHERSQLEKAETVALLKKQLEEKVHYHSVSPQPYNESKAPPV